MKKTLFILVFLPFLVAGQTGVSGFTITGKITGLADGTDVKLLSGGNVQSEVTKTTAKSGSFTLKGKIEEAALYTLSFGDKSTFQIYLDNSRINISGDIKQVEKLKVSGSVSHKDFEDFKKFFDPLSSQMNAAGNTINSMSPGPDKDALTQTYNSIKNQIQKEIDKYIAEKPRSIVSPFVLYVSLQFNDDIATLEKRFNVLDNNIRKSQIGTSLAQYIAYNKVGAIGTEAIDFTQPDTTGSPVSLSSFRGKYVLVDFWASWCRPCRMENPNVVAAYNKFRNKNFTVLGVSLDRSEAKGNWINAIHEDNLSWTHVSDLQYWNNAAAQLYRVTGIPFNMLVDPSGKIVGRNLRGPELESKLCEILGCN